MHNLDMTEAASFAENKTSMPEHRVLEEAYRQARRFVRYGKPADYIPELAKQDPNRLGIAICDMEGNMSWIGDVDQVFSFQSVAKVISLLLAIEMRGYEHVFTKVGAEPTGDSFNSIVRLETLAKKKPFNPMINAGAIAVASCIPGRDLETRQQTVLEYARKVCGNPDIHIDYEVFRSEKLTGHKNRAIMHLMKANGIIDGDVEPHLDLYFTICSLSGTCKDLAYFAAVLANDGVLPGTDTRVIEHRSVKLVRSLMVTCGLYNYSGEYAATVGMPSKSGVGGGIIACPIGKYGIASYGPALDDHGNSVAGLKVMEYLSDTLNLNMF